MRADTKVSCLVQILRRSQYAWHSRYGSLRSSACWNETRIILICSPKLCEERNCYRTFASSSAACMPTRYSTPEFLNTSETIEFILDFSTGTMAGGGNFANRDRSGFEVWPFQRKSVLILVKTDR